MGNPFKQRGRFFFIAGAFFIAVLFSAAMMARPAFALLEKGAYSETEKVGFSFHRLSGVKPDFKSWIKASAAYKNATPKGKVEMLHADTARLEKGFSIYHPDEDLITLEMDVAVRRLPDAGNDPAKMRHALQIIFAGNDREYYIPMQIGNIWVAIIMQDLKKQSYRIMETPEFAATLKKLNTNIDSRKKNLDGRVKITLRPVSVSMEAPAAVNDVELWPMLAEIASFSLWSRDGRVFVWGYEAPWYVSGDRKDLIDLYKD